MGQYVTESRRTPGHEPGRYWVSRSGNVQDWFPASYSGSFRPPEPRQDTYSFRTGIRAGEGSDLEKLIDLTSTHAALVQGLKSLNALKSSEFDQGHEFETSKLEYHFGTTDFYGRDRYGRVHEGVVSPYMNSIGSGNAGGTWPAGPTMSARGTQAIRETRPNRSPADLAQALIELKREGLPKLIGFQSLRDGLSAGTTGGEYLNLEFGIKPLLRDLRDVTQAIINSKELITTWRDEAGDKLHRQRTFPTYRHTEAYRYGSLGTVSSYPSSAIRDAFASSGRGALYHDIETLREEWFSGAYSYYLNEGNLDGILGYVRQAEWLLGLELTPELLWEITPWSWLIDWVSNIGDNISNATHLGSDGLVLRYGYMMRQETVTHTLTLRGLRHYNGDPVEPVTTKRVFTHKRRIRATPYGFEITPVGFSPKQWSILTALGMTRGNRSLRLSD